jgi:YD repeat-containing protein
MQSAWANEYVSPPPQFVTDGNSVDPRSTLLNYSETDIVVGSGVTEVQLVRGIPTHQANGRQLFGQWINSFTGYAYTKYDSSDDPSPGIRIGDTTLHIVIGNRSLTFTMEYMSPWEPGDPATSITTTGSTPNLTATVTDGDGTVYNFGTTSSNCTHPSDGYLNYCGDLTKITYSNGLTWDLDYESGRLKRARSNGLFAAIFEYPGSGNQPSKACLVNQADHYAAGLTTCPSGSPSATYTATTATSADGVQKVYAYTYGQPNDYFAMRFASDSLFQFHYKRFWAGGAEYRRGATLSGTGGDLWTYTGTYVDACRPDCLPSQTTQMIVTAPDGSTVKYNWKDVFTGGTHFIEPLPEKVTNALNYFQTIDYGLTGGYVRGTLYPRTVTQPEGNQFTYTYDSRGNRLTQTSVAKSGSGLANITVSATYPTSCTVPASCNKPLTATDAKGNVSNFTWASHGGVLTEMGPPPAANGARPLKVSTWTQRYAWVKNAGGTLVQAATPVWVLSTETQCQTVSGSSPPPSCDGSAPQTVTTYEYGATGTREALLVKGIAVTADGTTLRTCYGYDTDARRIFETSPNANLSSCS